MIANSSNHRIEYRWIENLMRHFNIKLNIVAALPDHLHSPPTGLQQDQVRSTTAIRHLYSIQYAKFVVIKCNQQKLAIRFHYKLIRTNTHS